MGRSCSAESVVSSNVSCELGSGWGPETLTEGIYGRAGEVAKGEELLCLTSSGGPSPRGIMNVLHASESRQLRDMRSSPSPVTLGAPDHFDQSWSDRSDQVVRVKLVSQILTGLTSSANTGRQRRRGHRTVGTADGRAETAYTAG